MISHRRTAVLVAVAALGLDVLLGCVFAGVDHVSVARGVYCAIGNAVTEGACTSSASTVGYVVNVVEFLTVVPLISATFSLFTSGLTATHVKRAEERIKDHVTQAAGPKTEAGN